MINKEALFKSCNIGNKAVSNRFVAQAMEGNDADQGGKVSERTIARYKTLAGGEWGIIIVEALSVTETSLARKNGMIINRSNLDGFKRLAETIKSENPDTVLLFQLTHAGRNSNPDFSEKVSICPTSDAMYRYLSSDEIELISELFANAAIMAAEAGADGIDLKMCHGYFGSEMLRPSNNRGDKWGGSFTNRTRFLNETVQKIQTRLKNINFLLGSRISMYEGIRGGCGTRGIDEIIEDLDDQLSVIEVMHSLGMHFVNISAGIPGITSEITRPVKGSQFMVMNHLRYTKTTKDHLTRLNSTIKAIGSSYSLLKQEGITLANENIEKAYTDFVGWGRQSFADPLLPYKVMHDKEVNWCTACSGCSKLMQAQMNDGCIVYNAYYKELNRKMIQKANI